MWWCAIFERVEHVAKARISLLNRIIEQIEHLFLNITAMAVKTARVLIGTYALGGPHPMSAAAVDRIHSRPDEAYRRRQWGAG